MGPHTIAIIKHDNINTDNNTLEGPMLKVKKLLWFILRILKKMDSKIVTASLIQIFSYCTDCPMSYMRRMGVGIAKSEFRRELKKLDDLIRDLSFQELDKIYELLYNWDRDLDTVFQFFMILSEWVKIVSQLIRLSSTIGNYSRSPLIMPKNAILWKFYTPCNEA